MCALKEISIRSELFVRLFEAVPVALPHWHMKAGFVLRPCGMLYRFPLLSNIDDDPSGEGGLASPESYSLVNAFLLAERRHRSR
jgi:hypothetical protein